MTDNGRDHHYRELLSQIEHELADWIGKQHELPTPVKGRMSRQSRHFPVAPNVNLQPDERGTHYLTQFPGWGGKLLFVACTAAVFMAGAKILDCLRFEQAARETPPA